jgi:hypothetical protein
MEFTLHRQSWPQAVQTTTFWPAITIPFFTGPWPMKLTLSTPFRRKHHAQTK